MRVCFSCGRQGHGVNRCSQVDISFPFLPPGWSVDVRNGQYRVTRTDGTGLGSTPGNEGWSGLGGSASRVIGDQGTTDPGGGVGGSRTRQPAWQLPEGRWLGPPWASNTQAFPPLGSHSTKDSGQNERKLLDRNKGVGMWEPNGADLSS